jgi:hypothetical protein
MINYDKFRDDEDFMEILDFLRERCTACEDEVADATDIDFKVVKKHFNLAQAIVAEEIDHGEINDPEGWEVVQGSEDYILQQWS